MLDWLRILGSIILIDLVLSGDNALVIGAVAASLQSKFRWIAFLVGGGGAILVRILLTYSFTILLQVPYLETIGGFLLLFIAARLLLQPPQEHSSVDDSPRRVHNNALMRFLKRHHILMSILTILVADLTTSLDNIVAIAALARGNTILLIAGLLLSITLLLVGSAIIASLIQRLPWLILVAAGTLAITAGQLVIQDTNIFDRLPDPTIYGLVVAIMVIPCVIWVRNYNSSSG